MPAEDTFRLLLSKSACQYKTFGGAVVEGVACFHTVPLGQFIFRFCRKKKKISVHNRSVRVIKGADFTILVLEVSRSTNKCSKSD